MKLFVIWSEISQTQITHLVTTTPSDNNESQITGFHKIRGTTARNHGTDFSIKVNKLETK